MVVVGVVVVVVGGGGGGGALMYQIIVSNPSHGLLKFQLLFYFILCNEILCLLPTRFFIINLLFDWRVVWKYQFRVTFVRHKFHHRVN